MKLLLLIFILFGSLFANQVYEKQTEKRVHNINELQQYLDQSKKAKISFKKPTTLISSIDDIGCPQPDGYDSELYATNVNNLSFNDDRLIIECILTSLQDNYVFGAFSFSQRINLVSFGYDQDIIEKNYDIVIKDLKKETAAYQPSEIKVSVNTLSSLLTSIFSLDSDVVNTELTANHQRLIINGNSPSHDFLNKSKLPAIFLFLQNAQNEIYSFIGFLFFVFLVYSVFISGKLLLDQKSREQLKTKIYIASVVSLLLLFVPFPNNGIITTNANKMIQSVAFSINSIADNLGSKVLSSAISNAFQNAGIKNIDKMKSQIDELSMIQIHKNVTSRYIDSCTQFTEKKRTAYSYDFSCFDGSCMYSGMASSLCGKMKYRLPNIKGYESILVKSLSNYSNTNVANNRAASLLESQIVKEYNSDGWISLIWLLPKLDFVLNSLQIKDISEYQKIKEEIFKERTTDGMISYLAGQVPFLIVPGADLVLSSIKNIFSSIPIFGGVIGSSVALPAAVLYAHYFVQQLPIYIFIIIFAVMVMLYFIMLLIYSVAVYFLLPIAVLRGNFEVLTKFSLSLLTTLIQPIKLTIVAIITYSVGNFANSYLLEKLHNFKNDVDNINILSDGDLSYVDNIQISLFSGVIEVSSMLLSAFLVYFIITKFSKIIMEMLGSHGQNMFSDSTSELESKIKNKK